LTHVIYGRCTRRRKNSTCVADPFKGAGCLLGWKTNVQRLSGFAGRLGSRSNAPWNLRTGKRSGRTRCRSGHSSHRRGRHDDHTTLQENRAANSLPGVMVFATPIGERGRDMYSMHAGRVFLGSGVPPNSWHRRLKLGHLQCSVVVFSPRQTVASHRRDSSRWRVVDFKIQPLKNAATGGLSNFDAMTLLTATEYEPKPEHGLRRPVWRSEKCERSQASICGL
jgi:hypothetical protein